MEIKSINGKTFIQPTFFWISNLGGGGSDKYRETVYLDLYNGIPTLYNYYYLRYPDFATKWLNNMNDFNSFGDFLKYTRESMINDEHYICDVHKPGEYEYDKNVYLLDSGARNILNDIIRNKINNDETIEKTMINQMYEYYDFADKYKFDFVIGYDLGGKYTFKDKEKQDEELQIKTNEIDTKELNNLLLEETIKYIKSKENYYPKVYATVHGDTPDEYEESIKFITDCEKKYNYEFYGYALGGIASSKGVNEEWLIGLDNKSIANEFLVTKALKIVKKYSKEKPVHVLGGGNKDNIPSLILNGATSFDCQTPGRRAYDGSKDSSSAVFDKTSSVSFSKYLPALLTSEHYIRNESIPFDYMKINLVPEEIKLCDCPACKEIKDIVELKKLYSKKHESDEFYYYARQIMNSHAIWQHYFLSMIVSECNNYEDLLEKYPLEFFIALKDLFN